MAPVFPDSEYSSRQQQLRERLAADEVDLCVISSPEGAVMCGRLGFCKGKFGEF